MSQGIPPRSQVRETGRMLDVHGFTVVFGVDHEAVTITAGSITIVPAADDRDDGEEVAGIRPHPAQPGETQWWAAEAAARAQTEER